MHFVRPASVARQDPVAYRVASAGDVPAIVDLVESAYRGEPSRAGWTTEADLLEGRRTDADAVLELVRSPDAAMLLAVDGVDELVACCELRRRDDALAYFGTFAVRPPLQGRGIGRALLLEAERRARRDWDAATMEMTVIGQRDELIAWYLRRGYAATGETRPFPYGDDRVGRPLRPDLQFVVLAKALR